MRILNFGSLNIDHVFKVDHIVRDSETIACDDYSRFCGGKGLNQSIALARAGATVWHAGLIGEDGESLRSCLADAGVNTNYVEMVSGASGQAVIQIDQHGENCIIVNGGSNRKVEANYISTVIKSFAPGDWLLLQNEINAIPAIIKAARANGMKIAFNPSPMQEAVLEYPLEAVNLFIVNEIEAAVLCGNDGLPPNMVLQRIAKRYPQATIVMTLGANGVMCWHDGEMISHPAIKVTAVDTTAAGDTFTGFFLAEILRSSSLACALDIGTRAAAICVTQQGAASSIPHMDMVQR